MRRSFLATLFPASHAALLQRWRRGEWTHEAGPLQRLPAELAGLAGLTLADLLARHPDLIGDAYGADLRDGHDASPAARPLRSWERLPPAEALAHHRDGHTLVYWHIGAALPALVDDARSVARELGCLPPDDRILGAPPRLRGFDDNAVRVALSFTPAGAEVGLGAHFDQFDSIAVQLRGEKDWYLASDPRLQFPLHNEGAARSGLPAYLAQVALDGAEAGPFTRVRLTPGAALLNPRGTFHATGGAADESLTLLLRFQFPAWLEVLTAALAEALSRAPELRQTAFGLFRERDASLDLHELAQHLARAGAELARGAALIDAFYLESGEGDAGRHHGNLYRALLASAGLSLPFAIPVRRVSHSAVSCGDVRLSGRIATRLYPSFVGISFLPLRSAKPALMSFSMIPASYPLRRSRATASRPRWPNSTVQSLTYIPTN